MIFRSNSTHFFRQNAWFLDPVYKKSSKIFQFETLFMSGRSKNHTLKGGTSPYSLCMGVSRPGLTYRSTYVTDPIQMIGLYIHVSLTWQQHIPTRPDPTQRQQLDVKFHSHTEAQVLIQPNSNDWTLYISHRQQHISTLPDPTQIIGRQILLT